MIGGLNVLVLFAGIETGAFFDAFPWIDTAVVVLVRTDVAMAENLGGGVKATEALEETAESGSLGVGAVVDGVGLTLGIRGGDAAEISHVDGGGVVASYAVGYGAVLAEALDGAAGQDDVVVAGEGPVVVFAPVAPNAFDAGFLAGCGAVDEDAPYGASVLVDGVGSDTEINRLVGIVHGGKGLKVYRFIGLRV